MHNSILCIIRHGESVWNRAGIFTGWTDVSITDRGKSDAIRASQKIKDIKFDIAFTSVLKRAVESLDLILNELSLQIPVIQAKELNERHYGTLQGRKKEVIINEYGEQLVHKWRRSFTARPLGNTGESLEDCSKRTIPYLKEKIYPHIISGKNVLMVGHGNSLRSIIMFIENMTSEDIVNFDLELTTPYLYFFNPKLEIIKKEIRPINGAHHSI